MLILILIFGFLLRVIGISHGLPDIFYSDEGRYIYLALNMGGGDLNPGFYPSLFFYILFFLDLVYIGVQTALGHLSSPGEAWEVYQANPTIFYVIGRTGSMIFSLLTMVLTYRLGKSYFSKKVGVMSTVFLGVAYMHVQYSQVAYIDVTLTFFIFAAVYCALKALDAGSDKALILSGLIGGLAISTKYNALPVVFLGPIAVLIMALRSGESKRNVLIGRRSILFMLFVVLGFTVGTPYWVLDFGDFIGRFTKVVGYYKASGVGQLGYDGEWNWFYYLREPLRYGLGLGLMVLGILGMVWVAVIKRSTGILFIAFPVIYFLIAGSSEIRTPRYVIPMIPFMCLSGAYLIAWVSEKAKFGSLLIFLTLNAMIVVPNLARDLRYIYLKNQTDTRVELWDWMQRELPQDSAILKSYYNYLPESVQKFKIGWLDSTIFDTRKFHASSLKTLSEYRKLGYQYLVLDDWHIGIIRAAAKNNSKYDEQRALYEAFVEEVKNTAELVETFSPYSNDGDGEFDVENIEFASKRLWSFDRLGPRIRVYRL